MMPQHQLHPFMCAKLFVCIVALCIILLHSSTVVAQVHVNPSSHMFIETETGRELYVYAFYVFIIITGSAR